MEVTPARPPVPLSWPVAALGLALPLLGLLLLILVRLSLESGERATLEHAVELTAVGDATWYQLPKPEPAVPVAVTTWQGQPLVPVSYRRVELRDSRLNLVGVDDAGALRIYTARDPMTPRAGELERHNEPVYLVKIGPEQYLKVQPAGKRGP